MKRVLVLVLMLWVIPSPASCEAAPAEDVAQRDGAFFGVGVGFYELATSWFWYNYEGTTKYNYPWHDFSRLLFLGRLEKRGLSRMGTLDLDLRGELAFGLIGGTKEDWLGDGATISDGGVTIGLALMPKFFYPLNPGASQPAGLYGGIGFQLTALYSNGEGVASGAASRDAYAYYDGWTEIVLSLPLALGAEFQLGGMVLQPEVRYSPVGYAFTFWEPIRGEAEMENMPSFWFYSLTVGFLH